MYNNLIPKIINAVCNEIADSRKSWLHIAFILFISAFAPILSTNHSLARNINVTSQFSEKELKVIISAEDAVIGEYKSSFLSEDNCSNQDGKPSKLLLDIFGNWKNAGESVIEVQNEIVESIRIGEHPERKVLEGSRVVEKHPARLRVVLDLKIKEYPPYYKIKKDQEHNEIIITVISMEKSRISLKAMKISGDKDRYDVGIKLFQLKRYEEAREQFKSVEAEEYRSDSEMFVNAIDELTKNYKLTAMVSYKYDDYVQLKPLDINNYIKESDYVTTLYLSGKYSFINEKSQKSGIGYSHYQTWHQNVHEYDLTGSVLDMFFKYKYKNMLFGLDYMPSYYWVDSESYLLYHLLKFSSWISLDKNFSTYLSYSYYNNHYFQNEGRDGHTNEFGMDIVYQFGNKKDLLFGVSLRDNAPSHSDYDYASLKSKLGFSFEIPSWETKFNLTGELSEKKYNHPDSRLNIKRRDTELFSSVLVSRKFLYDWLFLMLELDYTVNDSNIEPFDYQDHGISFSFTAAY